MSADPALDFLLPGDLQTLTGGYIYDRRIVQGLGALGWRVTIHSLHPRYPWPPSAALDEARATFRALPDRGLVVIDGLALGGMPEVVEEHARRLRLVALVHHPLAAETGLTPKQRHTLEHSERRALAAVDRIIVTSAWTGRQLADYGVPAGRVATVCPGTDPAPLAHGSHGLELNLLCVATLTPRKGHAVLFEALAGIRERSWHLTCVGSLKRDPATVADLRGRVERLGLTGRVTLLGELSADALARQYARADVFVLASYLEGYGMVLTEAVSRGLPVVSTSAGAIPETVPADAALLVPPGDSSALASALAKLTDDPATLRALASGARRGRHRLPTWEHASARFAAELQRLA